MNRSRIAGVTLWVVLSALRSGNPTVASIPATNLSAVGQGAFRIESATIAESMAPYQPGSRQIDTIARGLEVPTDLQWGPDGKLWLTERNGTISTIDPHTGLRVRLGMVEVSGDIFNGLMGLAFHPTFHERKEIFVYHSYRNSNGQVRNRISRVTLDGDSFRSTTAILENIPARGNHNGGQIAVGPDSMLYVTTGDAGEPDSASDLTSIAGKILRLSLDGGPAPGNPFKNRVWSYGHRNPQGLAFVPGTTLLLSAEHGPKYGDEVNLIVRGGNFGWPTLSGKCRNGSIAPSMAFQCETSGIIDPEVDFTPTVGLSDLAIVADDAPSEWAGNVFVTSLAGKAVIRLGQLNESFGEREQILNGELGRLRAITASPDGTLYVGTSNRDHLSIVMGNLDAVGEYDDLVVRIRP